MIRISGQGSFWCRWLINSIPAALPRFYFSLSLRPVVSIVIWVESIQFMLHDLLLRYPITDRVGENAGSLVSTQDMVSRLTRHRWQTDWESLSLSGHSTRNKPGYRLLTASSFKTNKQHCFFFFFFPTVVWGNKLFSTPEQLSLVMPSFFVVVSTRTNWLQTWWRDLWLPLL